MSFQRSNLYFSLGGDILAKYGTFVRRYQIASRGGEEFKETFTRSGSDATSVSKSGLVLPAVANAPRTEYAIDPVTGLPQTYLLLEPLARTNIVIRNRDLANAAWTKSSITAVRDQVGVDGVANSASSLLATGANGTCLQAIVDASKTRYQTAYAKRLVGSGTINMTMDNGATWTAIVLTTSWVRLPIPSQTLANPTVGFRIVTSGDKIAVDLVQNEGGTSPVGTYATSAIATVATAVTVGAESFSVPWYWASGSAFLYSRWVNRSVTPGAGFPTIWEVTSATAEGSPRWLQYYGTDGKVHSLVHNVSSDDKAPNLVLTNGHVVETLSIVKADLGGEGRVSDNLAADVVSAAHAAQTNPGAWKSVATFSVAAAQAGAVNPLAAMALSRIVAGSLYDQNGVQIVSTLADARGIAY